LLKLNRAVLRVFLPELQLSDDFFNRLLGWNERSFLALGAWLVRPPDVLVLDVAGNDPLGAGRVLDRLGSRPPGLALVYLKTQYEAGSACLPGGTCISLMLRPVQTAVAE
jgi:hypothetical protein